ncbi:MAG TPA: ABC transporter ATP-binding protein [Candidatus Thermoplasmatota archaeon]|nr:ABC transporter ATP-binding protein [Candidatus Thermoplasmatota archaeon]
MAGDGDILASVRGFPAPLGPLDLDVRRGDVILLEGPNGSGKTSLLRALAGLPGPLQPRAVQVSGSDPRALPATDLAAVVGAALQDPRESLVGLTVRSEFRLRGLAVPADVAAWADRDVATLSSGEARRVSLAAARERDAPLLVLDEPTEGLDADGRQRLLRFVDLARTRGAVVAADHDGLLAPLATRRVTLGQPRPFAPGQVPTAGREVLLRAPPCEVRLGSTGVTLPEVALTSGLHALAGPNGCGKSTLLLRLAGLRHAEGVHFRGAVPEPGRDSRLLLPHAGDLFTRPTVADELGGATVDPRLVPQALFSRHPLSLSAGEAERVALAKTLGMTGTPSASVRLYLLDEPEAHLDPEGRSLLLRSLSSHVTAGAVVVVATHDEGLLALAHSVIRLGAR